MAKKKDVFKTAIVEKRNVLNEIHKNGMSLQELRFFSIYLSKINARDPSTRVVRFPLTDFQKIMEIGADMNINHFRATIRRLLQQIVEVPNESGHGYTAFQLFKKCRLEKDEYGAWYVEIDAHDDALPLMFDFKKNYFTYELWNALRLKSPNQIRMYEILKQYEHIGKREISITELRDLLGIAPTEYPRWNNFKARVLDSCQKALAESTDICFTYEKGKSGQGGKWLTIVFHITKNEDYVDQLTLDDFIERQPDPEPDESDYLSDNLELLSSACNEEFNLTEMNSIFAIIAHMDLPDHSYGVWFARHDYLMEMYAELNVQAERKKAAGDPIRDRFIYFRQMLKNDARYRR